jgi:hypothetical protein
VVVLVCYPVACPCRKQGRKDRNRKTGKGF